MSLRLIRFAFVPVVGCAAPAVGATHYLTNFAGQTGERFHSMTSFVSVTKHAALRRMANQGPLAYAA
jgi:hypothetical protein